MDITPFVSGHSLWSSSLIFVGALLDWATLVIDPSGHALPAHVMRSRQREAEGDMRTSRPQTAAQQQAWHQLISRFYDQIRARSSACGQTFSPTSIASILAEVRQLPADDTPVQQYFYPEPLLVGIANPAHAHEDTIARRITDYMLHFSPPAALHFLECVVVLWAAQLPDDQCDHLKGSLTKNQPGAAWSDAEVRGYALYSYVAEPLER